MLQLAVEEILGRVKDVLLPRRETWLQMWQWIARRLHKVWCAAVTKMLESQKPDCSTEEINTTSIMIDIWLSIRDYSFFTESIICSAFGADTRLSKKAKLPVVFTAFHLAESPK